MASTLSSSTAPAKPWDKRPTAAAPAGGDSLASAAQSSTASGAATASRVATGATAASPSLVAGNAVLSGASTAMNTALMTSQYGTGAATGYGATGYGTTGGYGGGYGTAGGYGTGTYGSGYGGVGGYGGGYGGIGSYGGLGGGYGGYGGGYGGYGGMSRMGYGGMMGGGMGGGMMDPNGGGLGWLSSFNQIVSSIGQITELLGMNAEALNFCIGSFVHFLERIGAMCAGIAAMLAPRPVFPPGHPRHGEPPATEEEEKSRVRRVRIFQFMVSMAALACAYKGLRWLTRLRSKTPSKLLVAAPSVGVGRDLEHIFQRTVGVNRF